MLKILCVQTEHTVRCKLSAPSFVKLSSLTRQAFVTNNEAHWQYHCCRGKAISIIYSDCVFVALVVQHAKRMRRIVICGLSGSTIFFDIIS